MVLNTLHERYVTKENVEKIHDLSLKILSEIGVKFENARALELFRQHGMKIEGDIVFFSEADVTKALSSVPSCFEQYSTKGCVKIGNESRLNMPACGCVYVSENGKLRRTRNEDIVNFLKLSSTSDLIDYDYVDFFADTSAFTPEQKIYANMAMMLKYSHKTGCYDPDTFSVTHEKLYGETVNAINIIRKFEGVTNRETYVNTYCVNTLSPLCYDFAPLEKMFAYAEENQPLWIIPCAMPALTSPPSIFSTLAMTNAEILAGVVLSQLINPGLPVIYGNTSAATDLRSVLLSIGTPETALMAYATVALARYYKMPVRTGGGLSDAKDCDFQAGAESMMMLNATYDAGADLILHAFGIMGSFNVYSYEKYILDEECARYALHMCRGIKTTEDYNFFEQLKQTGPRGAFINYRTPKAYREDFVLAKDFNKQDPNVWQKNGAKTIKEAAREHAFKRISEYEPPQIDKEQAKIIEHLIPEEYQNGI